MNLNELPPSLPPASPGPSQVGDQFSQTGTNSQGRLIELALVREGIKGENLRD